MAAETEIEDDVAEMVCHLASEVIQSDIYLYNGPSEVIKQQFRDALIKLIDERISMSGRTRPRRLRRNPKRRR